MPKPSDIPDDEWVAAFVKHRDARNQNGKLAIRPRVALELGLSVTAVNNYMTRRGVRHDGPHRRRPRVRRVARLAAGLS